MTEREKRAARKQWRIRQYKSRQKTKESKEALTVTPLKAIGESTEATCSQQKTRSKKQKSKSIPSVIEILGQKILRLKDLKEKLKYTERDCQEHTTSCKKNKKRLVHQEQRHANY